MNLLLTCLYDVGLYAAYVAGAMHLRATPAESRRKVGRPPRATLVLMLAITVVTTLQFFCPAVLVLFERDDSRFAAGEWWRLVTALFAQDGGWSGGLVNLVGLFLVGSVAERLWGGRRWLVFFFVGGVISEGIALAWQPIGAGNSVANFSLAAGVTVVSRLRSVATRVDHGASGLGRGRLAVVFEKRARRGRDGGRRPGSCVDHVRTRPTADASVAVKRPRSSR